MAISSNQTVSYVTCLFNYTKASCARPDLTVICNFARMSKITNDGWNRSGKAVL